MIYKLWYKKDDIKKMNYNLFNNYNNDNNNLIISILMTYIAYR